MQFIEQISKDAFKSDLLVAFDARKAVERNKNASNESIQAKLDAFKKSVAHDRIVDVLMLSNVSTEFTKLNVYATEKVVNIAQHCAKADKLNHYTISILKTALALEAQGLQMTQSDAISACSLKCKTEATRERFIVKYERFIEASTASTQASSSISALKSMNVLRETRNASNERVYSVNTESHAFDTINRD